MKQGSDESARTEASSASVIALLASRYLYDVFENIGPSRRSQNVVGLHRAQGDKVTDTGTSKATMMVSPSGFSISLSEHIKK